MNRIESKSNAISPEDAYEGRHIRRDLLKKYVLDLRSLAPVFKNEIELHTRSACPKGECQKIINQIVTAEEERDKRMVKIAEDDR